MEMRDIEIFLAVAQELHFGKAAQRLYLSPARVSQSIKNQERRIGGVLIDRSKPRDVRLTPLGQQLLAELKPAYQDVISAIERARQVAAGISGVLRVSMIGYNAYDYQPFWEEFRRRHPTWELRVRSSEFSDQFGPLYRGEADIVIAWVPVDEPGLTVGPVISAEPMVAIMPVDHELASESSVSLEVFGDRGVFAPSDPMPDYWEDAVSPFYTPRGRPIDRITPIATLEDILTTASTAGTFTSGMSHIARYYHRPGIAYVPIADSHLVRWAPVWRSDSETAQVRAFARVIRDLGCLSQS